MGYHQGKYTPKNPDKYLGDVNKIRFMSSWELRVFKFLDVHPNIKKWSSEEIAIKYQKPTTQRIHNYYPDLFIVYEDKNGNERKELIEIKPLKDCKPGKSKRYVTKLQEDLTYVINIAKWQAAQKWCNEHGITFRILTENEIFKQ